MVRIFRSKNMNLQLRMSRITSNSSTEQTILLKNKVSQPSNKHTRVYFHKSCCVRSVTSSAWWFLKTSWTICFLAILYLWLSNKTSQTPKQVNIMHKQSNNTLHNLTNCPKTKKQVGRNLSVMWSKTDCRRSITHLFQAASICQRRLQLTWARFTTR